MKNRYKLADKEISVIADGQVTHLALALSPLKQTDGEFSGLIVVLDDLTQLIKAQKIAAWKEVAQRVAHEIKNPLTPIQLSAERIIKNLQRSEPGHREVIEEGARTIIQEARTIKSLVDEFSELRPHAQGPPPVRRTSTRSSTRPSPSSRASSPTSNSRSPTPPTCRRRSGPTRSR